MNTILHTLGDETLRLLYPPRCPVCDRLLDRGFFFCPECRKKLPVITGSRCRKCSRPLPDGEDLCPDCLERPRSFDEGLGLCSYDAVMKRILYALKYKNRKEYGVSLGHFLAENTRDLIRLWGIDAILPVPVHKKRLRQRGYNQAEVMARVLAEETGLPLLGRAVVRQGETRAMKLLDREERRENLRTAFAAGSESVRDRHVLILDDIYTTGATVEAIGQLLFTSGAASVSFLTVCIGGSAMI